MQPAASQQHRRRGGAWWRRAAHGCRLGAAIERGSGPARSRAERDQVALVTETFARRGHRLDQFAIAVNIAAGLQIGASSRCARSGKARSLPARWSKPPARRDCCRRARCASKGRSACPVARANPGAAALAALRCPAAGVPERRTTCAAAACSGPKLRAASAPGRQHRRSRQRSHWPTERALRSRSIAIPDSGSRHGPRAADRSGK